MHAGKMKKGRGQRAKESSSPPAASNRTSQRGNRMKMHAGEAKNDRGQRSKGGTPAGRVETPEPAEKWEENARRRGEERQGLACKGRQIPSGRRRNEQAGGETE
ncbi:MAG: hypothetical protein ACLR23_06020 [Clostridia bacterium]